MSFRPTSSLKRCPPQGLVTFLELIWTRPQKLKSRVSACRYVISSRSRLALRADEGRPRIVSGAACGTIVNLNLV